MFQGLNLTQLFVFLIWYLICILAFLYCSYTDLQTRRIPNAITYPCLRITIILLLASDLLSSIQCHCIAYNLSLNALLGGLLAGGLLFSPRLIVDATKAGMGDVKLGVLGGLLTGPYTLLALSIAFFSALLLLTPLVLLQKLKRQQTIAFGPFLAFGFIATIFLLWPQMAVALTETHLPFFY